MPEISALALALGTRFIKPSGAVFRGVLRAPPSGGASYDAGYTPRRSLVVARDTNLKAGEVITDTSGTRYLCAAWASDGVMGVQATRSFILFAITGYERWSRPVFSTEPISGQRKVERNRDYGMVAVCREFYRSREDGTRVDEEVYRVLTGSPLQIGDLLEERRVQRVEQILGVYSCEAF